MKNILVKLGVGSLKRYRVTLLLWLLIVLIGLASYTTLLKREGFPSIETPVAIINGSYFVNNPKTVDDQVVQPLNKVLIEIPEIEQIRSNVRGDFFNLVVQFDSDISSKNGIEIIQNQIDRQLSLPEGVQIEYQEIEAAKFNGTADLLISVYKNPNTPTNELVESANELVRILDSKDSVRSASVEQYYKSGVNPITGEEVQKEVAFGQIGVKDRGRIEFYPSVTVNVERKENVGVFELSDEAEKAINEAIDNNQINGAKATISADFSESVNTQIESLQSSMVTGLIVVILISFILISWRASIIIALFMLSGVLAIFGALYLIGYTLNTITLFALVLVLGLFVDDATIVVEAIDANNKQGRRKLEIIKTALSKAALASLAGTLTTVLVFAPMLFVSGILGEFIRQLPVTIIISLLISLLFSVTIVPFMAGPILLHKKETKGTSLSRKIENGIASWLAKFPLLLKTNKKKGVLVATLMVLLSLVFFASGLFIVKNKISFNIFPRSKDADSILISTSLPSSTSIDGAKEVAGKVNKIISSTVGENAVRVSYLTASERGSEIQVDLVPFTKREVKAPELVKNLESAFEGFDGATINVIQLDVGPPADKLPFKVQIYSEDEANANQVAMDISQFLSGNFVERANGEKVSITEVKVLNSESINRKNNLKYIEVNAGFNAEDVSALVVAAQEKVEKKFDANYLKSNGLSENALKFDFGQETENAQSFQSTIVAFFLAIALMYLLLVIQFNSFSQPLLIFTAIPFSLFGVALGLWQSDNAFSFFVMIGLIGLIGITVNNTILFTDYANQEKEKGHDKYTAISEAIRLRFRPLLVTTLTTVIALIPLTIFDPFWEALSLTLISGLLSSTFLVVLSFPYYYILIETIREKKNKLFPALK
ncbi:efflux RND transporter permease subunit [Candidatus Saccharibacteria bacterium CPR2]|nr:efflux RND transporter permease subunit [Candidatus Saccharibacteria bacterium CPR2]